MSLANSEQDAEALYRACRWSPDYNRVRSQLEHGTDPDHQFYDTDTGNDRYRRTPLHWACYMDNVESVRALIRYGAHVECIDSSDGNTPLHDASHNGSTGAVQRLLEHNCNTDAKNNKGETPLDVAVRRNKTKVVKLLKSHVHLPKDPLSVYPSVKQLCELPVDDIWFNLGLELGLHHDELTAIQRKSKNTTECKTTMFLSVKRKVPVLTRDILVSAILKGESNLTLHSLAAQFKWQDVLEYLSKKDLVTDIDLDSVDDSTRLGDDDVVDILKELSGMESEFNILALSLHLPHSTMNTIKRDLSGKSALGQVIIEWVLMNYNHIMFGAPSWRLLVAAVDTLNHDRAKQIASRHKKLSPILHPITARVLPENWEEVANKETNGTLYRNTKTSEERTSPIGHPLLRDPSYPEVTFFDEHEERVLSSSGGHVDFDNGAEITVPPDAVQPGGTISVKVQPSFAPKDVFVMPSDIYSASASYLITSSGSELNKDMIITLEHHVNTDENASDLLFLQTSATPTVSDSSHVYEYKEIPDSDAREDFPRGENSGRLTTRRFSFKFLKVGLRKKVKKWFDGSRSSRVATNDRLLEPASPKHQSSDLNRYTVRVYRSPVQTTGDRVAIIGICLYGRLYAKFLQKLDKVLIRQDYPEVSSSAVDRTISGPYSFKETEAKLTVVSAPLGWTVEPDTNIVSKCGVDFPETGNFKPEKLHDYPPKIVCRFYPSYQASPRSTCILSFTGFDKDVKVNVPLKAPKGHVQKNVDTRILQEAAASLRTTAVQLKEVQVVPTVNNILSLIDMMTKALNSSTLEVLATQADLIKSEVQTVLDMSKKVIEECTIQSILDNVEASRSKIEMLSHQLCLVTKARLRHCQDLSEKAAALDDVISNGAQLLNSVGGLLNLMHIINEVTSSGTKQLHQSGPPSTAMKTKTPASASSLSILNITALQNKFNLTDQQIDCPIEERDLFYLGGLFGPWRSYTGVPGLGLSRGEQHTIHTDRDLIDNQRRSQAALRTWQSHNPLTATFRKLLNIVLELNDGRVAKSICQYIVSKPSSIA